MEEETLTDTKDDVKSWNSPDDSVLVHEKEEGMNMCLAEYSRLSARCHKLCEVHWQYSGYTKIDTADKYTDKRTYHMFLKSLHKLEGQYVIEDSFISIPLAIIL
jgi:hypothetical protein